MLVNVFVFNFNISVAWNPSQPEFVTIIFESGAVEVLKVTEKIDVVATETNDFGACCVAWSPKGKQMVIGKGTHGLKLDFIEIL